MTGVAIGVAASGFLYESVLPILTTVAISVVATHSSMSQEQLKAFLNKVKGDTSLREKLKAAKTPEHVVEISKENGHHFNVDALESIKLTDDELEGIGGGNCVTASWFNV